MPIYEYQCERCAKLTDVKHGFKETNTETCPACGGELKRRFTPAGIVFKGSGFYVTDSRKSAERAAKGADGKTSTEKTAGAADGATSEPSSRSSDAKAESGQKSESQSSGEAAPKEASPKREPAPKNTKDNAAA